MIVVMQPGSSSFSSLFFTFLGLFLPPMANDSNKFQAIISHCKEYGFKVKLQAHILMDGETRGPDDENFLSCPSCYETVAAHTVEGDASIIRDEIPTIETPYENTTEIMGANPRRMTKAGQRALSKRRKERDRQHHKDSDIDREIRRHGEENVHVLQDSNP